MYCLVISFVITAGRTTGIGIGIAGVIGEVVRIEIRAGFFAVGRAATTTAQYSTDTEQARVVLSSRSGWILGFGVNRLVVLQVHQTNT